MIDAGELREHVEILTPGRLEHSGRWVHRRRAWAKREDSDRTTIFSSVGLAARTVIFTLRRQRIEAGDVIVCRRGWHYVTAVEVMDRAWLKVTTAVVKPVECHKDSPEGKGFTGFLTEKYLRHEMLDEPYRVNQICYVLVTAPDFMLDPGALVDVAGEAYQVLVAHLLDQSKNEYEILRTVDL